MQGARLKLAREAAGYRSAREAALENGWAPSTYSAHEAGRRKMGEDDAEKYCRHFKAKGATATAKEILWGENGGIDPPERAATPGKPDLRFCPVRGVAKAGTWIEVDDSMQIEFDPVPCVPTGYTSTEQFAYRISGHSMDKRGIVDGDYVVCVPYFMVRLTPRQDDIVIAERRDGQKTELSCKRLVVSGNTYELHPDSTDPRFKPILVPAWDEKETSDAMQIEIVGLVIGKYTPF